MFARSLKKKIIKSNCMTGYYDKKKKKKTHISSVCYLLSLFIPSK